MTILFLLAAAAAAASPEPTPPEPSAPKKERIICKSEKFVGTHLTQRVCMTETEWRVGKENAKDVLNDVGRGGDFKQPIGPNN